MDAKNRSRRAAAAVVTGMAETTGVTEAAEAEEGAEATEAGPPACVHHWVLGDPKNGRVVGTCRRCDETRIYPASPESTDRFDDYRELTAASSYNAGARSA